MIQQAIAQLLDRRELSQEEAYAAMMQIMTGEATQAQIGGFLVALRMKGETVAELAGCARAMRANALAVQPRRRPLPDIVGTGKADPRAAILSAALMLDFLGENAAADRIRAACVEPVSGSTSEIGSKIAARVAG